MCIYIYTYCVDTRAAVAEVLAAGGAPSSVHAVAAIAAAAPKARARAKGKAIAKQKSVAKAKARAQPLLASYCCPNRAWWGGLFTPMFADSPERILRTCEERIAECSLTGDLSEEVEAALMTWLAKGPDCLDATEHRDPTNKPSFLRAPGTRKKAKVGGAK